MEFGKLCPGLQEAIKRNINRQKIVEENDRSQGIGSYGRTTSIYGNGIAITCGPRGFVEVLRPGLEAPEAVIMPKTVGSKIRGLRSLSNL